MLAIGLTGGIGSGKTTVANFFADLGITIIDTDILARHVVQSGSKALQKIVDHFGNEILNKDLTLNRNKLAGKIFNDPEEKTWLETLLHPLIREEVTKAKNKVSSPYCIIVIPLLVETMPNPDIDRILVVEAPQSLQISRVQHRDQRPESEISAIIQSQASSDERLAVADDVIMNDGNLETLKADINELHKKYLSLCASAQL